MKNGMYRTGRKGRLSQHPCCCRRTKEIFALEVTDEKIHESKMLKKLVNHILDNHDRKKIKFVLVLADGAHDKNRNFRYLEDKKIISCIKYKGKKELYCFS